MLVTLSVLSDSKIINVTVYILFVLHSTWQ